MQGWVPTKPGVMTIIPISRQPAGVHAIVQNHEAHTIGTVARHV
jgi:hypothetical protein